MNQLSCFRNPRNLSAQPLKSAYNDTCSSALTSPSLFWFNIDQAEFGKLLMHFLTLKFCRKPSGKSLGSEVQIRQVFACETGKTSSVVVVQVIDFK